ncbi:DUF5134 domain-containing protein [Streptomyces phaeochromogenes]
MGGTDVVWSMLTLLFAAAAIHELRHRVLPRRSGWSMRTDGLLHVSMAMTMCAMPWSRGAWMPAGAQAAFFAGAALWFPLSALSRRHGTRLTLVTRSLPSAAGMAAMAWTVRPTQGAGHETLAAHAGHSMGTGGPATHGTGIGVLALYLLVCALRSLTRDMPGLRGTTGHRRFPAVREVRDHFWEGTTHLGTVVMLLMHQG